MSEEELTACQLTTGNVREQKGGLTNEENDGIIKGPSSRCQAGWPGKSASARPFTSHETSLKGACLDALEEKRPSGQRTEWIGLSHLLLVQNFTVSIVQQEKVSKTLANFSALSRDS